MKHRQRKHLPNHCADSNMETPRQTLAVSNISSSLSIPRCYRPCLWMPSLIGFGRWRLLSPRQQKRL